MDRKKKPHVTFLTEDEIMALSALAHVIVKHGGVVEWKAPISDQWLSDLKSANEKLEKKLDEIREQ